MHLRLQPGMRENPASDRRHGSLQKVRSLSNANLVEEQTSTSQPPTDEPSHAIADADSKPNAASFCAAAGGEMSLPASDEIVHERTLPAIGTEPFEPLIGSPQAAKMLGNIHVKTLQRYARLGRLPGYQIGGHWYFRESELDGWLRHQINSNRQSVR